MLKYRAEFLASAVERFADKATYNRAAVEYIEAESMLEAVHKAEALAAENAYRPMPFDLRSRLVRKRFEAGAYQPGGSEQLVSPWLLVSIRLHPELKLNSPLARR